MNPLFVILVFITAFFIWLFLAELFKEIGGFMDKLITTAKDAMTDNEEEDFNEKE